MLKAIKTILALTRYNAQENTAMQRKGGWKRYADGVKREVTEARAEIKKNNAVHLEDELGDIFWDYANLLRVLEKHGYIRSINHVFARAAKKYTQRAPALPSNSQAHWRRIKARQKKELAQAHERYRQTLPKAKK